MAANYKQDGKVLHYVVQSGDNIKSGDLVAVEDVVGVAMTDGEEGDLLAVSVEGVYGVPVPAAVGTVNQGVKVYYDPATKEITLDDGDVFFGYAWETGEPGGVVPVKLLF